MRGIGVLLAIVGGGVYCSVDFLLLLDIAYFISEFVSASIFSSNTSSTSGVSYYSRLLQRLSAFLLLS